LVDAGQIAITECGAIAKMISYIAENRLGEQLERQKGLPWLLRKNS
jgi:hypothetical protein